MTPDQTADRMRPPSRWDGVVRVSHWTLALVVIGNALMTEGGSGLHVWLGWIGAAVLALRLVWGVVGRADARFTAFPPNPMAALRHLGQLAKGQPRHYASHNPAGAMMVYAIWASLAVVIGTGLMMTKAAAPWTVSAREEILLSGDWSQLPAEGEGEGEDGEGEGAVKDVHELFANLMLVLAVLHVAGVAVESRAMRRNLVAPMLLGSKDAS